MLSLFEKGESSHSAVDGLLGSLGDRLGDSLRHDVFRDRRGDGFPRQTAFNDIVLWRLARLCQDFGSDGANGTEMAWEKGSDKVTLFVFRAETREHRFLPTVKFRCGSSNYGCLCDGAEGLGDLFGDGNQLPPSAATPVRN